MRGCRGSKQPWAMEENKDLFDDSVSERINHSSSQRSLSITVFNILCGLKNLFCSGMFVKGSAFVVGFWHPSKGLRAIMAVILLLLLLLDILTSLPLCLWLSSAGSSKRPWTLGFVEILPLQIHHLFNIIYYNLLASFSMLCQPKPTFFDKSDNDCQEPMAPAIVKKSIIIDFSHQILLSISIYFRYNQLIIIDFYHKLSVLNTQGLPEKGHIAWPVSATRSTRRRRGSKHVSPYN